jgi:hypothetical protein
MSGRSAPDRDTLHAALDVACRAPSLHNAQPWRWRRADGALELHADPSRMLPATDPAGRQMVISCGAALQHAVVAFAALGWQAVAHRLPSSADPDHLAHVEFEPREFIRAGDVALATAAVRRRTDRRPYLLCPIPGPVERRLVRTAQKSYGELLILPPEVVSELLVSSRLADLEHGADDDHAEQAGWNGSACSDGVPATALLTPLAARSIQTAGERHRGELRVAEETPDGATLTVLRTGSDDRDSWLRTGEALGAVVLEATVAGLASCALTHLTEIAQSRAVLERALLGFGAGHGHAQVVVRIGHVATPLPGPRSPRRPIGDATDGWR